MYYTECQKLFHACENLKLNVEFRSISDGFQIILYDKTNNRLADAVMFSGSYGSENFKFEIMGGLTAKEMREDTVLGYLTIEEVLTRFIYCYTYNTPIYLE